MSQPTDQTGAPQQVLSPKLILGNVGGGKTILMTVLGIMEAAKCVICKQSCDLDLDHKPEDGHSIRRRKIYANYDLSEFFKSKYPDIYKAWFYVESLSSLFRDRIQIAMVTPYKSFEDLLLVDEAWEIWESRESIDRFQILMSRLIFLSRKLGFELIMSAQLSSSLDKRARFLSEMWILASKEFTKQGEPFFKYYRWKVHPVNGTLISLPNNTLTSAVAKEAFDYYHTTKLTSSEFETTLAELNALLGSDYEELAVMRKHDDEYIDRFQVYGVLAKESAKRFTSQDISRLEQFKDWKLTRVSQALAWLVDNKMVIRVGLIHGMQTYQMS